VTVNHPAAIHFPWNGNVPRGLSNAVVITTLNDVLPLVIPGYFKSSQAEENYRKIVQQDLDRTDLLMTISEYSKDEIIKNFVVKNEPVVVPLGPTLAAYNGLLPQTTKKLDDYFIYVGGYDPRKGIDKLIKVFIDLHREKRLCSKLILTGSKNYYSTEFKQLIDEGIQRGIVVEKGYVQDQELVQLIAGAIALIYPSKYEGFGLPPLEAMALGCPVITTGCTAVPEVCGDAAWYIDPDDNLEFANGIIMLQNDKELRLVLKSKGYKQAAKFSWELSAMKFMANLTSVCQSKQ
jgi:glycosyltransferase involved in cell wall biosynthesis